MKVAVSLEENPDQQQDGSDGDLAVRDESNIEPDSRRSESKLSALVL